MAFQCLDVLRNYITKTCYKLLNLRRMLRSTARRLLDYDDESIRRAAGKRKIIWCGQSYRHAAPNGAWDSRPIPIGIRCSAWLGDTVIGFLVFCCEDWVTSRLPPKNACGS